MVEKDSDQEIAVNVAINIKGYKLMYIPQLMWREYTTGIGFTGISRRCEVYAYLRA